MVITLIEVCDRRFSDLVEGVRARARVRVCKRARAHFLSCADIDASLLCRRDGAGSRACLELADGTQEGLLFAVQVPREAALQAVEALKEPNGRG